MTTTGKIIAASMTALMLMGAQQSMALNVLDSSKFADIDADTDGVIMIDGVTFTALGPANAPSTFTTKGRAGFSGVGVAGLNGDEIDIGETVSVSWGYDGPVSNFSVALLFNGPEFNDYAEIAKVTAYSNNSVVGYGKLAVDPSSDTLATWSFMGGALSVVTNLSAATFSTTAPDGGGAWRVWNPFGGLAIDRLDFTAVTGPCGPGKVCGNQSDYVLSGIHAVPEPQTYALLLAGLGAVAFMAKRRRIKN